MVFTLGNIETKRRQSAPLYLEAFEEQPCEDQPETCVKSTGHRGSECFGDNVTIRFSNLFRRLESLALENWLVQNLCYRLLPIGYFQVIRD